MPSWLAGRVAARGRDLVASAITGEGLKLQQHAVLAAVAEYGLTVTPQGIGTLQRCAKLAEQANDVLLAPLNATERTQLLALLTRVHEA